MSKADKRPFCPLVTAGVNRSAPLEPPETLADLIRVYLASADWRNLAASTQTVERPIVGAIVEKFGDMPLAAMEKRGSRGSFLEWRDDLARTAPRAADMKLGRLATILKFGVGREIIDRNPLATFKRIYKSGRSEIIWKPEHFAALNGSKASAAMKLAAFVALHTGQRRGDLIAMKWRQYDGAGIALTQSKTGRAVYVPCTKALKASLDDLKALAAADGGPVDDLTILTSARRNPWTVNAFRLAWPHAFDASGIEDDLHFHDIRGTAVTMLAEAGCTVPEIATITGHTLASAQGILDRYVNRTRALAESAMAKFELRLAAWATA